MSHQNASKILTRMSFDCYGQVPSSSAQPIVDELNTLTPASWTTSSVAMFLPFDGNETLESLEPGNVWIVTNVVMD